MSFGFSTEARDAPFLVDLHDAEGLRIAPRDRNGGDGDVRAGLGVLADDVAEIHPVQLIAAQDEQVIEIVREKVNEIFADGIRRALVPGRVGKRLLCREQFHEATGEMIELVGLRNMPVQRRGIELGKQVNPAQAGIDAIGNRDVDDAIFAGERHSGLGALLGQRK